VHAHLDFPAVWTVVVVAASSAVVVVVALLAAIVVLLAPFAPVAADDDASCMPREEEAGGIIRVADILQWVLTMGLFLLSVIASFCSIQRSKHQKARTPCSTTRTT
jgi:hypothetical protein